MFGIRCYFAEARMNGGQRLLAVTKAQGHKLRDGFGWGEKRL